MTVMNEAYPHRSLETRGKACHTNHMGKNQDEAMAEGMRGKYGQEPLFWIMQEGMDKAG